MRVLIRRAELSVKVQVAAIGILPKGAGYMLAGFVPSGKIRGNHTVAYCGDLPCAGFTYC